MPSLQDAPAALVDDVHVDRQVVELHPEPGRHVLVVALALGLQAACQRESRRQGRVVVDPEVCGSAAVTQSGVHQCHHGTPSQRGLPGFQGRRRHSAWCTSWVPVCNWVRTPRRFGSRATAGDPASSRLHICDLRTVFSGSTVWQTHLWTDTDGPRAWAALGLRASAAAGWCPHPAHGCGRGFAEHHRHLGTDPNTAALGISDFWLLITVGHLSGAQLNPDPQR